MAYIWVGHNIILEHITSMGRHNRTLAATKQRLCNTCFNPANKSAVRNLDVADNVGVCSGLESRLREMF